MNNILFIGVGNPFRQDDAVGFLILDQLREQVPASITTVALSGEATTLIEIWQNYQTVYLFDAVCSGAAIATIHRIDTHKQSIPTQFFHTSTHTFGIAEVIELARSLHQLPDRLILYGVEGKTFTMGMGLSAEVEQAAAEVVSRVLSELEVRYTDNLKY